MTSVRIQHRPLPIRRLLALLICCLPLFCFSQEIMFERVSNELGLSQNYISALCQDQDGFIWVGTKDGLNRYDGYRFKTFTHDPADSTSISNNYILSVLEDSQERLWIGTKKGLNLYDPASESFVRVRPALQLKDGKPFQNLTFNCITEDKFQHIWLGTGGSNVIQMTLPGQTYDRSTANFTIFENDFINTNLEMPGARQLVADEEGNIWCNFVYDMTLIKWDAGTETHQAIDVNWLDLIDEAWIPQGLAAPYYDRGAASFGRPFFFFKDKNQSLWIKTIDGFGRWDLSRGRFDFKPINFTRYDHSPLFKTLEVNFEDQQGRFWLRSNSQLKVYDPLAHRVDIYQAVDQHAGNLDDVRSFSCLLEDRAGTIWAGSTGKGLYRYSPIKHRFQGAKGDGLIYNGSPRVIYETADTTLWVADFSLVIASLKRGGMSVAPLETPEGQWEYSGVTDFAYSMHEDRAGNFWLGMPSALLKKCSLKEGKLVLVKWHLGYGLEHEGICDIHEDEAGHLWVITPARFGKLDPAKDTIELKSYLEDEETIDIDTGAPVIHAASDGTFWLGTNEGLKHYLPEQDTFITFVNDPQDRNSLSANIIKTICPDPNKPEQVLWLGTSGGGLNRFDIETETFKRFSKEDGLPDHVIYGILSDEQGFLWMSTNLGLSRFDPVAETFLNFTASDGLQDNEFNTGAYFKSPSGELFFGGIGGINAFYPEDIKVSDFMPPIVITDFLLANKKVDFKAPDSPLSQPITETKELVLSYRDKIFGFEFSSMDFTDPFRNQYAYKLENFDDEWQYVGKQRTATFTNINPGSYTFRVKGTNYDGIWNEEGISLKIRILPPWWRTWWAYVAYFFLLGSAVYFLYQFQLNRSLEQAEALRLKEMDTLKTRLYTNITHEFRTPLTVIMGMTEQLTGGSWQSAVNKGDRQMLGKSFALIRRNSKNLLRLINQLLDLSKLESGSIKMDLVQGDIINYLQYLTESFHSMAEEKGIRLVFYPEIPELVMDFDEVRMQHIIYNLLSNAIKFTDSGGKVVLHVNQLIRNDQPFLKLKVQDTGRGIAEGQIEHIFDRFYQADSSHTRKGEGTGIGLSLTRELVDLMNGQISVESEPGKGTTFTLLLPVRREEDIPLPQSEVQLVDSFKPPNVPDLQSLNASAQKSPALHPEAKAIIGERPLLLLIEDNRDVTTYIRQLLQTDYQVETAANGQLGIDQALERIPDLIISDVMMPEKDGYEVCETLKNDERTSHIPIVLLTAKAEESDKITGLRTGADAYLKKPFNKEELFIRLEKLLEVRRKLQQKYASSPLTFTVHRPPSTGLNIDDLFLQKLHQIVGEQLDDPELGADQLSRAVNLSRSQLYRKMKALLDQSPSEFIRKIRLHRAMEMLKTTDLNISEIAYEVGFNDPNYFSRAFHKEFGESPTTFRK